jgi:hypothetical protein
MLVLSSLLLLAAAASVAAQDETKPVVVGPEDKPGADVIVFLGDEYEFDLSESYDDVGITNFLIEFQDGGTPYSVWDTDGVYTYTFTSYGQTWVKVQAFDAYGNVGIGKFTIDVAELRTTDLIIKDDPAYVMDHSIYVQDADVDIRNSMVTIGAGVGKDPEAAGGGEIITEGLTIDSGLPGYWSGNSLYADPYTKLIGQHSIRLYKQYGSTGRDINYYFNDAQDFTEYNGFRFYWRSSYYRYSVFYYIRFYDSSGGYATMYQNWYDTYAYNLPRDWLDVTGSFNPSETYWSTYYMGMDWTSVSRIYIYFNYYYSSSYYMYIDGFELLTSPLGDHISDSTSNYNGDPWDGYWSGLSTTTSRKMAGDRSLTAYKSSSYYSYYYYFSNEFDLTEYDGAHFFFHAPSNYYYSSYIYYIRWYDYHGYYYAMSYYRTFSLYQNVRYGWVPISVWTHDAQKYSYYYGFDFSRITRMEIRMYGSIGTFYMDGFEFTKAQAFKPSISDYVPTSLYVDGGDMTITDDSVVYGQGTQGARIMFDGGTADITNADFDNMWWTTYPGVDYSLGTFGGLEIYGDAVVSDVGFANCGGVGLALFDGTWTVTTSTIDLTGTTMKAARSAMLVIGATERTTGAISIDIKDWDCADSSKGTGILFMAKDTSADIDLTISNNRVSGNAYAGIAISNVGSGGFTPFVQGSVANLDVTIEDQLIEDSGTYGIMYYLGDGEWAPSVVPSLTVDNVTVRNSGDDGMAVMLDMGATNLDAYIANSTFEKNGGSGISYAFDGFFGWADIEMFNLTVADNAEHGIEFTSNMAPWVDGNGNVISPVSSVNVTINTTLIKGNDMWGIVENHNAMELPEGGVAPPWSWSGPTRTTLLLNMSVMSSDIIENDDGGWMVTPEEGWFHANMDAIRMLVVSNIDDNRGPALYVAPNHDMYGGGGTISDIYMLSNVRLIDNSYGVYHELGGGNYGYYSEIHLNDCRIEGNDNEAITVFGSTSTDGIHTWGNSRVLGTMILVDSCRINSPVTLELTGADDEGGDDWEAKSGIQFTNNVIDVEDEDIIFHISAWPWSENFKAWGDIGNNRYFRGHMDNGVQVELYGGSNLDMDMTIRDQKIMEPGGSGIHIVAGTLVQSLEPHQIFGTVMVDNVTITDAGANGINFTVDHREIIGSKSRGVLEAHDVSISGVQMGISASEVNGQIYDSTISETSGVAVDIRFSVFDFYSCDVGPVTTDNIKVLTKGAARMWFDVSVDVRWASGVRVLGAVVSVQDNTWATIGVDTVDTDALLPFGYVNSYTVLPDSVYSRSPYLVSGVFLGLKTEQLVDIDGNMVIDLVLVDDVLPRLTVNAPMDGSDQTSTSLEVKGHAWDMHSGLDRVEVSIDDFNWFTATGAPDFEYTFEDVPEGRLILTVKAIDNAGNERTQHVSVLVDATPPVIIIIEPAFDMFMTQEGSLNIIGVTELGATVMINNMVVDVDLTLFHHMEDLHEGMNEIRIEARDSLGNTAVHVLKVELDTIAPPLIVTEPAPDTVSGDRLVTVSGQSEAGATVLVGGELVANIDGHFTTRTTLFEGPNTIVVTATDAVGNVRTARVSIVIDTQEPWLELVSPRDGDVYGVGGILVQGWVEAGSIVLVNDQEVTVVNGNFMDYVSGSEGDFSVTITVIDGAGNTMSKTVPVIVDTTAPTIVLDSPEDGTMTSEESIEISGKLLWDAREEFRDVSLVMNSEFAPFSATGDFKVKYDLNEGTNPIIMKTEDDVGNSAMMTITIIRDSKAPFLLAEATPTFDHPVWNKPATYRSLVYIEGVTEPGAAVNVDGAEVDVADDGSFNISVLLDSIPEGKKLVHRGIMVESTDAAGNSRSSTIDVYRLEQEETDLGFADYESSQYWVLLLSLIILVGAIVAAALLLRRMGRPPEDEFGGDMYDEGGM